jgi:DNA-binding LacI/PurR family transcriptional regulator
MPASTRVRKRTVGLREIADELSVSVSLVSKVLSGRLGTSGANAEKIRAIHAKARELNYRKNLLAEALRTGRQNVFACMIHRHGAPGSTIVDDMVGGISEEASGIGQRLLIHYYENSDEFLRFLPLIHQNSADGLIVAGIPHREVVSDLHDMHSRGLPIITVHDVDLDPAFCNVGLSQVEVTRLATLHLADKGCRKIAHLRVRPGTTNLAEDRFQGYREALKERQLEQSDRRVVLVEDFLYESGRSAVKKLIETKVDFDGIVCQSDQQAVAAVNYLSGLGRKVPAEVKLIGVDNAPFCQFAIVPLSSVSQEFRERGREAVKLLARKLAGEEITSVQVPPVVWVRESSL